MLKMIHILKHAKLELLPNDPFLWYIQNQVYKIRMPSIYSIIISLSPLVENWITKQDPQNPPKFNIMIYQAIIDVNDSVEYFTIIAILINIILTRFRINLELALICYQLQQAISSFSQNQVFLTSIKSSTVKIYSF